MPSGGARARSGPPADPMSGASERRKGRGDGWTDLPASYSGKRPTFPLDGRSVAETKLWAALWKKPQAAMWARLGLTWQVAHYCRTYIAATEPGAPASLTTAVLRQEDTLGISTVGLAALRWRIVVDETAAARSTATSATTSEAPAAPVRRLRAAPPSAVGE